jgi:hypothetical protein
MTSLNAIIQQADQPAEAKLHMPEMLEASWEAVYYKLWPEYSSPDPGS